MKLRGNKTSSHGEHLFEDASINQQYNIYNPAEYVQQQEIEQSFPLFTDPMNSLAANLIADHAPKFINNNLNIEEYVVKSNIKFYFSVNTNYVVKKLGLLFFPYFHKNWSDDVQNDRQFSNINARDLYIPVMSFITYILIAGVILGIEDKFSPEKLGLIASSAFICNLIEYLLLILTIYILNIFPEANGPNYLDWLSYIGYKYYGMIIILNSNLFFASTGYYIALFWMSLSLSYFLIRSMRARVVNRFNSEKYEANRKRFVYLLLYISIMQAAIMWWLTKSI